MAVSYPRQFGKYVLLKPLAKGGMGEIYVAALGQIDGFDKMCVIKKVIPEKTDEGKAKRFLDEAKVVLRLAHSGLVNTFDAGQVEREFYIAMEMVEGKDLREVWNRCVRVRHRIPIEVALHVAREVARALFYVHTYGELNLVHRDVAPPNIMLAYNGDVKLTDFGLARSALKQEHTQPGVVFGRAAYLAPEQARGEIADPGTDVYSLAVVLWELLTGHQYLQIAGLDPAAALAMVRHPKPMPPSTRAPWITPALDEVLMCALAPDRSKRFASAEEFRLALSDAIVEAAPRTDAARVSELMHAIYEKAMIEEAAERERFLKEVLPSFRAATTPQPVPVRTPPPVPLSRRSSGKMPRMAAPPKSVEQPTPDQSNPEARRRAKREAALHVLAELANADEPAGPSQVGASLTVNPTDLLPRVAVVTVIYRCEKFMRGLLESVAQVDYPRERLEFHLVDNGADDGTLAAARTEIERLGTSLPTMVIHEPGKNVGFAIGNNIALRAALDRGVDYCFLLNPDAAFEPGALKEVVRVAESGQGVGSVQSLLVLGDEPEVVNTSGNHIHFLGFGYVGGYRRSRAEVPAQPREIAFSSGACMLLPAHVLRAVGLLDETLWLYHEDLDLGWRIRLAGFRNLIAPASVCRHFYEFSRAQSKWYWMERNRWIVVLKNYRLATILLLLPAMMVADCGLLLMAAKAGWLGGKVRSLAWFLRPSSWAYLWRGRRDIARIRRVSDREILRHFTAVIDFPDFRSPVMTKVIEPVWKATLVVLRAMVRW